MDINQYLSRRRAIIDKAIFKYIPRRERYTEKLQKAAKYSLMSGGKRIRPILTLAACEAVSGEFMKAMPVAAAIEMIHTYTLIHDDLPAMDDDDMRRGKPTCHKVFGEDVAILAGDMLNTLAFEIIAENYGKKAPLIISELSKSLGIKGVVGQERQMLALHLATTAALHAPHLELEIDASVGAGQIPNPARAAVVPTRVYATTGPADSFFERRTRVTTRAFGSPKKPRTVCSGRKPRNPYASHSRRCRFAEFAIQT